MKEGDPILCINLARYMVRGFEPNRRIISWSGSLEIEKVDYQAILRASFTDRSGQISLDLAHPVPDHIETVRFMIRQNPTDLIVDTTFFNEQRQIHNLKPHHTRLDLNRPQPILGTLFIADNKTPFPTQDQLKNRTITPEQESLYHLWEIGMALSGKIV